MEPVAQPAALDRSPAPERAGVRDESFLLRALHLTVLTAFAISQPLFTELDDGWALITRDFGTGQIVLLVVVAALALPAALMAIEGAVQLWSRRAAMWLHLLFVAGLASIFASQLMADLWPSSSSSVQLVILAVVGFGFGLAYARTQWIRSVLTVLTPMPVLFACLFLFSSPVERLAFADQGDPPAEPVQLPNPVVMIVLDEMQGASLMDRRGRVDATRFPNFARLADGSTWFRNATTVHSFTEFAVPAIVTGRRTTADTLPTTADHERNLFALLSGNPMSVQEPPWTDLCPHSQCPSTASTGDVLETVGRTSLRHSLPGVLADKIEPATYTYDAVDEVERFVSSLGKTREPALHYLHLMLPHIPYAYVPSGKRYTMDPRASPIGVSGGITGGRFDADPWPAVLAQQGYLLQLMYTDRLLGAVLDRLEATGMYNRSLVILTADHGVSFHPDVLRREVSENNFEDILSVPFFIKAPGQTRGHVSDSFVRNIDAVPTMMDLLGLRSPWPWEGQSVRAQRADAPSLDIETIDGERLSFKAQSFARRQAASVRTQVDQFGTGESGLYRIGPHPSLIGRAPRVQGQQTGTAIDLVGQRRLVYNPNSGSVPAQVAGTVVGPRADSVSEIALALNGRIATTTRTFTLGGGRRFAALLPESRLRAGANALSVYAIGPGGRLERIASR